MIMAWYIKTFVLVYEVWLQMTKVNHDKWQQVQLEDIRWQYYHSKKNIQIINLKYKYTAYHTEEIIVI